MYGGQLDSVTLGFLNFNLVWSGGRFKDFQDIVTPNPGTPVDPSKRGFDSAGNFDLLFMPASSAAASAAAGSGGDTGKGWLGGLASYPNTSWVFEGLQDEGVTPDFPADNVTRSSALGGTWFQTATDTAEGRSSEVVLAVLVRKRFSVSVRRLLFITMRRAGLGGAAPHGREWLRPGWENGWRVVPNATKVWDMHGMVTTTDGRYMDDLDSEGGGRGQGLASGQGGGAGAGGQKSRRRSSQCSAGRAWSNGSPAMFAALHEACSPTIITIELMQAFGAPPDKALHCPSRCRSFFSLNLDTTPGSGSSGGDSSSSSSSRSGARTTSNARDSSEESGGGVPVSSRECFAHSFNSLAAGNRSIVMAMAHVCNLEKWMDVPAAVLSPVSLRVTQQYYGCTERKAGSSNRTARPEKDQVSFFDRTSCVVNRPLIVLSNGSAVAVYDYASGKPATSGMTPATRGGTRGGGAARGTVSSDDGKPTAAAAFAAAAGAGAAAAAAAAVSQDAMVDLGQMYAHYGETNDPETRPHCPREAPWAPVPSPSTTSFLPQFMCWTEYSIHAHAYVGHKCTDYYNAQTLQRCTEVAALSNNFTYIRMSIFAPKVDITWGTGRSLVWAADPNTTRIYDVDVMVGHFPSAPPNAGNASAAEATKMNTSQMLWVNVGTVTRDPSRKHNKWLTPRSTEVRVISLNEFALMPDGDSEGGVPSFDDPAHSAGWGGVDGRPLQIPECFVGQYYHPDAHGGRGGCVDRVVQTAWQTKSGASVHSVRSEWRNPPSLFNKMAAGIGGGSGAGGGGSASKCASWDIACLAGMVGTGAKEAWDRFYGLNHVIFVAHNSLSAGGEMVILQASETPVPCQSHTAVHTTTSREDDMNNGAGAAMGGVGAGNEITVDTVASLPFLGDIDSVFPTQNAQYVFASVVRYRGELGR